MSRPCDKGVHLPPNCPSTSVIPNIGRKYGFLASFDCAELEILIILVFFIADYFYTCVGQVGTQAKSYSEFLGFS